MEDYNWTQDDHGQWLISIGKEIVAVVTREDGEYVARRWPVDPRKPDIARHRKFLDIKHAVHSACRTTGAFIGGKRHAGHSD